jgi:hypothetical protein
MSDQNIKAEEDAWLIKVFKDVETLLSETGDKSNMDWTISVDFEVFSEYLVRDIKEIQERSKDASEEYYYYVCRHIFDITDWMRLIVVDNNALTFMKAFEDLFEKKFGNRHILQTIYNNSFEKWIFQKQGQYQLGENFYNILRGKLYYRNRFGAWFEVDRTTAFDLKPTMEPIEDGNTINKINCEYKETHYDAILRKWKNKQYTGELSNDFLKFDNKETSPEEYYDFSIRHIGTLLKNPISIAELERWNGGKIEDLESVVKICARVLDIVKKRRSEGGHTVYLLRDCIMFYELHKAIDILNQEDTSSDQLLIGRKLLTYKKNEGGYYVIALQILYYAHKRYSTNFIEFYKEYTRLMDQFISLNPRFAIVVNNLADYIKEHISTDRKKIVIFDIGFQGSIAIFTKYIIDRYISPNSPSGKIEADVRIGVGAQWSKELFGNRYDGEYFSFLKHVQIAARSDQLYHYKNGSLDSGKLEVEMGSKEWQHKATIELIVLIMITLLAHTDK